MIGWLGDFFRLWWGLLYWNTRKSLFRLRRGRGRCPCQNPSDSGRAGETACEAAQYWHRPERFRRVCPLLRVTPEGLRCSVHAAEVRPFWGRALGYGGGGLVVLYLGLTLAAFAGLRIIGYRITPLATVWPPDWRELRVARSDYFVAKAQRALDDHRISEAILSLEIAFHANPRNYAIGLQLAQLMSVGQPDVAERLFAVLMRDHPEKRSTTAEVWLRFLLEQGRFEHAAMLAARLILDDPTQRPAWMHALFLVTRFAHDDRPLRELIAKHSADLPTIDVALLNTELLIREGKGLQLLPGLTAELPREAGSYGPYFQVSRLIALGRPADALTMLDRYTAAKRLTDADVFRLRLEILATTGHEDILRRRLDGGTVNLRELALICTALVRHPDPRVLTALAGCLKRSHLPPGPATYSAYTAYFVACGVVGDTALLKEAAAKLKELSGARMERLDRLEAFFTDKGTGKDVQSILPSLPGLSVDMIYALYEAYPPPRPSKMTAKS